MTRWPAIHTDPALARMAGLAPHWMGIVGVLAIVPFVGWAILFPLGHLLNWLAPGLTIGGDIVSAGFILGYSPLISWAGLLIGVPAGIVALRAGRGGWGVALSSGAVVGAIIGSLINGPVSLGGLMIMACVGAVFAGVYWLAARLLCPRAFIALRSEETDERTNRH